MPSGPSSVTKQSALLCSFWLRKSCACFQMLHDNPAAGLPCSPLGLWCDTLGLNRHGLFFLKSLKCPCILLSSMTRCHRTMQRAYRSWVSHPSWRKTHCCCPFLTLLFSLSEDTCHGLLCLPKAIPFLPAPSKPQSPKRQWARGLRMQCGQHGTAFGHHNIIWSSALLLAWPGFEILPKVLKSSRWAPPHHCESEEILSSTSAAWEHLWCWYPSRSKPLGAIGSDPWRSLAGECQLHAQRKGTHISPYHCDDSALEE